MHPGSIRQECKYAINYSAHRTNTNVEEERVHMALFRGHSNDGGLPSLTDRKKQLKRKQGEKKNGGERRRARKCTATHCLTFSGYTLKPPRHTRKTTFQKIPCGLGRKRKWFWIPVLLFLPCPRQEMKLSRERMLHNVSLFNNTRGSMEKRKVLSYDNGQKKR